MDDGPKIKAAIIAAPARLARLSLFEAITGYTEKAARRKIET